MIIKIKIKICPKHATIYKILLSLIFIRTCYLWCYIFFNNQCWSLCSLCPTQIDRIRVFMQTRTVIYIVLCLSQQSHCFNPTLLLEVCNISWCKVKNSVHVGVVCEDKHSLLDVFMDTIKPVFRDLAMLRGGHTEVWGLWCKIVF
jgi:hypothetical protein